MIKKILSGFVLLISLEAKSQLITDSILVEQHYRTFCYYQPKTKITNGSIMFVMHGSGGSAVNMLSKTILLESVAAKEKLLIVYPNGYQHYWNECRKYSTAAANKENINEAAFFTAMINYFEKKYGVSKNKIFAAGFSGGGHMAYKLAFTIPGQIKAIAAIVANMPDSASCDCTLAGIAKQVLIVNGTDDNTNPYNGGEMFVNNSSFGVVRSTQNTFAYWASLAGYKGEPQKTILPDADTADHKIIERFSFYKKNKPAVALLKVVGGHHDYPNDIDVYMYAWNFFKRGQ